MLNQLPIKKEYLLAITALLLLLASYRFAFRNTIVAWQLHSALEAKANQGADLTFQPGYLERKSNNIDRIISIYQADTAAFRSNIINRIASIAEQENVKLSEVPVQDLSYSTNRFMIEKLDFEGDYFSLLKAADSLQSEKGIGGLRSITLRVKKVNSNVSDAKQMILEVYLEIVK